VIIGRGKPKYPEKNGCCANLSTTNPMLTALGFNPGVRFTKPAINRLHYGMLLTLCYIGPDFT
jgi:hypothetical protein